MKRLHLHFLTLFPDPIDSYLRTSILGRAHRNGLFDFTLYQLRDFAQNRHKSVDDLSYGGGGGMVLRLEPLVAAVEAIKRSVGPAEPVQVICFTAQGQKIDQGLLDRLAIHEAARHFILVCGHYEGIDQRFLDHWVDRQVSLGDFIVTGGELPAMVLADALVRQLDGAIGGDQAAIKESFRLLDDEGRSLLEYPHYTRPPEYRGHRVPAVLLGGDHGQIAEWRRQQSKQQTQRLRPDLLSPTSVILTKTEDSE